MNNNIETERLILTKFSDLTEEEKNILVESWKNPFNAKYNCMKDPLGCIESMSKLSEPTFTNLNEYYDCMYFRVIREKETQEIIGNCRFGKHHLSDSGDIWDFGFNILLKDWRKGYGIEILGKIIEFARENSVKTIIGGADKENFASYKAMIRNGFVYDGIDEDGDYRYILDLNKEPLTSDEINKIWNYHLFMTRNDLGADKFQKLEHINNLIVEMVARIHNGENEEKVVAEYFEKANAIDEFLFN